MGRKVFQLCICNLVLFPQTEQSIHTFFLIINLPVIFPCYLFFRLSQKQGQFQSKISQRYNHHANNRKKPDDKENIWSGDFSTTTINEKWVIDITYIHVLKEGWTYPAFVMDIHNRKITGYAYGKHMTVELALQAVKNAGLNVKNAEGIILHSNLGSRYTSELYLHTYQDFEEAQRAIFEYIESRYNRKRIHSAPGYKTPQQVEDEILAA